MALNIKDVQEKLTRIKEIRGDDEAAHAAEDDLWEAVLLAICNDADSYSSNEMSKLACEALKTRGIAFERWCA